MTVTVLASQTILIPREIMCFSRNISRLYHHHQKLCRANNFLLKKCLSPIAINTWSIQRTCHSNKSTVDNFPSILTKEKAKEVVSKLTAEERNFFLSALAESKSDQDKAEYQRQLGAHRWCNELGRSSKIPSLGDVDATGKYCPVPDSWLIDKNVKNVAEPTMKVLVSVAIENAIPFIAFGFFDNSIMILAGDTIESMLNNIFSISTMTAAALGNTVSDIIGIGLVPYVELFVRKCGFRAPKLTPRELKLPKIQAAASMGRVIGITVGCLCGMIFIPVLSYSHNGG